MRAAPPRPGGSSERSRLGIMDTRTIAILALVIVIVLVVSLFVL
jgi:hypothetical protein